MHFLKKKMFGEILMLFNGPSTAETVIFLRTSSTLGIKILAHDKEE